LEQVNCNIIGVVLNGMKPEISPDFQDYKQYSYYYSYGVEEGYEKESAYKRGLSFLNKKINSQERSEKGNEPTEVGESVMAEAGKKQNRMKLSFLFVALIALAAGLLWQNGVVDPFEWIQPELAVKEKQVNKSVKKKMPPPAVKRVGESATTVSPNAKRSTKEAVPSKPVVISKGPKAEASKKRPVITRETSPFKPPSMVKKVADPVTILPRKAKRLSQEVVPKKPVVIAGIPKGRVPAYPYSLYIGSFKTLKRANSAVSIYTKKGLRPAYKVEVSLSNGAWYRVYMGYFESSGAADKFRRENELTETEVKKTPYANLIGTYSSTAKLEDKIRSLKKLGFSSYVITDHGGKYRLFVGVFYPKVRAERLRRELESKGIPNRIVKR
jgi:cell division protein FtsN